MVKAPRYARIRVSIYDSIYNFASINVLHAALQQQKQPPEMFGKKRCSQKFCKIHTKTPVPDVFK